MIKYLVIYFVVLEMTTLIIVPPDPFTQLLGSSLNIVSTVILWLFLRSKRCSNKKRVSCIFYVLTLLFHSAVTGFSWLQFLLKALAGRL